MNQRAAGALLIGIALLFGCSDDNSKKRPAPPPAPVITAKAEARDMPVSLRIVGRTEAYEAVTLKARVDGQVAKVLFSEGQRVKAGDALIQLDQADFIARLKQAEATAARDKALAAKTRSDTARYSTLREKNFVSEEKVNDVRTNEAAAIASSEASQASADLARLQVAYTTIRAPFAGIVGARLVFPGSSVKANDTVLAVVNRVQPLLVSFSVPEKHLPRLREAMLAAAKTGGMKVNLSLPGSSDDTFTGEVHFIDNTVDTTTGTILLKALLPNTDERLTPGQFLNLSLLLETLPQATSVPNEAIQQGENGNFVFVVKADQTVDVRQVDVQSSDKGWSAVRQGLAAGEAVVIDGQLRLAPGVKVREVSRSTDNPTAAQAPRSAP